MATNRELREFSWDNYVKAPMSQSVMNSHRRACGHALQRQRNLIKNLIEETRAQCIAFLGSGYLNDVPIELLFNNGNTTYFVDWIPEVSEEGLRGRIITEDEGRFNCLFCSCDDPSQYCCKFRGPISKPGNVCQAFRPVKEPCVYCENYMPGDRPDFVARDITAGRAKRFAEQANRLVLSCHSPEQAFQKAIRSCYADARYYEELPIDSNSVDVVTSSLVASQFDNEPYHYFSILLELRFGRERILQREKRLRNLMEQLRTALFKHQMDGHVREMYRILDKDGGKGFFSVELFRNLPGENRFFLIKEICFALEMLSQYFHFNFHHLAVKEILQAETMGDGTSIIQSYVITPRTDMVV